MLSALDHRCNFRGKLYYINSKYYDYELCFAFSGKV